MTTVKKEQCFFISPLQTEFFDFWRCRGRQTKSKIFPVLQQVTKHWKYHWFDTFFAKKGCLWVSSCYIFDGPLSMFEWWNPNLEWTINRPLIYLYLIFAILEFEISSLMNWIFFVYFKLECLRLQQAEKLSSNQEKIQFIKLDISNLRIAKIKGR